MRAIGLGEDVLTAVMGEVTGDTPREFVAPGPAELGEVG